jgi:diguanylate cyclase (GGDEF)-like protein
MIVNSDALVDAAHLATFSPDPTLGVRIAAALRVATAPLDLGKLYTARAIFLQGKGDTTGCVVAARAAIPQFVAAGAHGDAAFASSMAANFIKQNGDLAASVDLAADAVEHLANADPNDIETIRASIGVAGLLMRASAFDLTIKLVEQTFRRVHEGNVQLSGSALDTLAYNVGYISAEGGHATDDAIVRERRLAPGVVASDWLIAHGSTEIALRLMGPGLRSEIAHARGKRVGHSELEKHLELYDSAPEELIAWHRLVRGTAALHDKRTVDAIALLSDAIPGLEASANNHCLVRALNNRAAAHGAIGDWEGAYADATRRGDLTRSWQIDSAHMLAEEVRRRVIERRDRAKLQTTTDQLLHDIDHDAMTGTLSRHWLEHHLDQIEQTSDPIAVVMLDIDHFKDVNDVYGHSIGDKTLTRFGGLIMGTAGPGHPIARVGGEEFVVLVYGTIAEAETIAEQIRLTVATYDWESIAPGLAVTTSAGTCGGSSDVARQLVIGADEALLEAKRYGRNRVVLAPSPVVF